MAGNIRQRMLRGAVLGFVLAVLLSSAPIARAAEQTITPNPTGYYTRTQDPTIVLGDESAGVLCTVSASVCLNPGTITGGTPNYFRKDNYIYVATIGTNEDANGAIAIPLFSLPLGSVVKSMELDFFVENEASAGTFGFLPSDPNLMFCLATEGWAGQDSAPWESRPDTDCGVQALPKLIKEETRTETNDQGVSAPVRLVKYTVDLMPMAKKWASGTENNGVLIRPTPDAPPLFEAAIRSPGIAADALKLRVTYDPGATPTPVPVPVPEAPTDNAPSFGGTSEPPAEEPEPPIAVEEPDEDDDTQDVAAPPARPVSSTSTPWWMYIGLPLGGAMLFALGRGSAAPLRTAADTRAGPVSRLMDRETKG